MTNIIISQTNKLATMLGLGGVNGAVSIAALAGLFRPENAFMLSVLFLAGPGSIITAILLDGSVKERMLTALLAGIIATIIVVFAAGIGTNVLSFLNLNTLKIAGGIAVMFIGLIIMGIKIPQNIPMIIIGAGILIALIGR